MIAGINSGVIFGSTAAAEASFQANVLHVNADGVWGPATTSTCVGYAQTLLVARGFPIPIDNTFGKKTLLATINIQTLHHIKPVTGVIGAKTWKVIAP